jgi:PKD repeat protein
MKLGKLLSALGLLALISGAPTLSTIGVPSGSSGSAQVRAAQPSILTNPSVSEPVSPADTRGLPAAPPLGPFEGEPLAARPILPLPRPHSAIDGSGFRDPALQTATGIASMPPWFTNFEGIPHTGVFPPDPNGQVGPHHYLQIVNALDAGSEVRIWDKVSGQQLYDFGLGALWPSGTPCNEYSGGDPVALYDQLADRWVLSQLTSPPTPPYSECIAVSKSDTPTNVPSQWWLYRFTVPNSEFNDYPKLAVWPDGYYMSANLFTSTASTGVGVWVFDRTSMLDGDPATFQFFDVSDLDPRYFGLLPSNLMGSTVPPAGAPNYYMSVDMGWDGTDDDVLHVFEFHTDWDTPANSTFGLAKDLVVDPFNWNFSAPAGAEVPQPHTSQGLDDLADRLMMFLWYRNFGDHESLVVNHTVNVGSNRHGIRWYEIRGGAVDTTLADATIYQQGTFAPSDGLHRWMGSIAMDRLGNIALGYSVSSNTVYPSIRYAGRLTSDPLGTLAQGEAEIMAGSGSQTGSDGYGRGRWGDYSAMAVDPFDDCSFWYTQEYIRTTGAANWQTRVASFYFPGCPGPQEFEIAKTPAPEEAEIGMPLAYTVLVTDTGGPATSLTISDTLPEHTIFSWADNRGSVVGDDVLWTGLQLPAGGTLAVSFGVTVTCVAPGTAIVNDRYSVYAAEWITPTYGPPVTTTAVQEGITAGFSHSTPVLREWPVVFENSSVNAMGYHWAFGDGGVSNDTNPTHTYTGPTGTYTVALTASNLCTSTVISQPLTVQDYGVTVSPPASAKAADPSQAVSYTLSITNTGTLADSFGLAAQDNNWPTEVPATALALAPGQGGKAVVRVTVPSGADGGQEDSATVIVRPLSDPRKPPASASAVLTTKANDVYGLDLAPTAASLEGRPAQKVSYSLLVTNTSNVADAIAVDRVGSGWPTTISPESLTLARDTGSRVEVQVTVPLTAAVGQADVARIRAVGTGGYAESELTTLVAAYRTYLPAVLKNRP